MIISPAHNTRPGKSCQGSMSLSLLRSRKIHEQPWLQITNSMLAEPLKLLHCWAAESFSDAGIPVPQQMHNFYMKRSHKAFTTTFIQVPLQSPKRLSLTQKFCNGDALLWRTVPGTIPKPKKSLNQDSRARQKSNWHAFATSRTTLPATNRILLSKPSRKHTKAFDHLIDNTIWHVHVDIGDSHFPPTPFQTEVVSTGPHDCLINGCQSITLIEGQSKKHSVCGPTVENSYQQLNPPAFKHWRFGEKLYISWVLFSSALYKSLHGCLHMYMPVQNILLTSSAHTSLGF